jgi:hypothetical protein
MGLNAFELGRCPEPLTTYTTRRPLRDRLHLCALTCAGLRSFAMQNPRPRAASARPRMLYSAISPALNLCRWCATSRTTRTAYSAGGYDDV